MKLRPPLGIRLLALLLLASLAGCAAAPAPAPAPPPLPTAAQAGATTVVAVAPAAQPCCPKPTLWDFLGVKGLLKFTGGAVERLRARLGMRFPGLEARPALLSITDPANLGADSPPAVKAAAEAKANEDAAPQKIKALRYLARLGCSDCYPDIEPALIHAMEDCTEAVRYEAVVAVRKLCAGPCNICQAGQCCGPDVIKKLDELANKRDDRGCYVEPSARVRRVARLALECCGTPISAVPSSAADPDLPTEGPSQDLPPPVQPPPGAAPPPTPTPPPAAAAMGLPGSGEEIRTLAYGPAARDPFGRIAQAALNSEIPPAAAEQPQVWALVNGDPIYDQEIRARVEVQLAAAMVAGRAGEIDELQVTQREIERAIDRKLLFQAAVRSGGSDVVQRASWDPAFAQSLQSADSLQAQAALEDRVATQWLAGQVQVSEIVSRQEIFQRYRMQLDRFQQPELVRWEHCYAAFQRFGSPEAAQQALDSMRATAQGSAEAPIPAAALVDTRSYAWTRRDEVPGAILAQWLFALPPGQLSPVIRDEYGLHLVRVLERRAARTVPLEEAAAELQAEIRAERAAAAKEAIVRTLRSNAQIESWWQGPAARTATSMAP